MGELDVSEVVAMMTHWGKHPPPHILAYWQAVRDGIVKPPAMPVRLSTDEEIEAFVRLANGGA